MPPAPQEEKQDVKIIAPDYSLKKLIGEDVDIKQIFSAENINKAQEAINSHKENFVDWVKEDLVVLESAFTQASANASQSHEPVKAITKIAASIKARAGTFGYTLGTMVAKSLEDFCNRDFKPAPEHLLVIRKHIEALQAIFDKRITGDGGAIGVELSGSLYKLVSKFKSA